MPFIFCFFRGGGAPCIVNSSERWLTDERHYFRRGRHGLRDKQEENSEREKDGERERDPLAGLGRQDEPDEDQGWDDDAGDDQVVEVEHGAALHDQVKGHCRESPRAAILVHDLALRRERDQIPLSVRFVHRIVARRPVEHDVDVVSVVRPGPELEAAVLGVEREVEWVHGTRAEEDGVGHPRDRTVMVHRGVRPPDAAPEVVIGTERN